MFRDIVCTWTLSFNDVLDADKLHVSLSRLLEIGDWSKVGGRLRLKKNGELEIHVPRSFTAERPAISYSHQTIAMDIEDHPLAKTLPKATETSSIQPGPEDFRDFAARKDAPATLDDYIYEDTPQLSLHITSFNDATLVALSWPHTLMDVMGQQALLHGWSLVLANRESEVPALLGAREDAIYAAADAQVEKEEFRLEKRQLRGWAMFMFGLRFVWDIVCNRRVETRTIFLPKRVMAELRSRAQADLVDEDGKDEKPFISEGDVLTAWAVRMVASSLPKPRPVTMVHALNARFRISSILHAPGVYMQNMVVGAFTLLSPDVATGPLGPIALENRRYLMEQSTEGQVLALTRKLRREYPRGPKGSDHTLVCGQSNALLMPFTNWTRAAIYQAADFSPAVIRPGETGQSRRNPPGILVFHQLGGMRQNVMVRNVVVVLGKDHGENYWLMGILLPRAWARIEEEIERMSYNE